MATPFDATTWLLQTFLILIGLLAALPVLRASFGLLLVLGSRLIGRESSKAHAFGMQLLPKFARILLTASMGVGVMTTLAPAQAASLNQSQSPQAVQSDEQLVLDRMVTFGAAGSTAQPSTLDSTATSAARQAVVRTYRVVAGDSLWSIAQAALTAGGARPSNQEIDSAWRLIWQINFDEVGADPSLILPGQVLRIPGELHD